MAMVRSKHWRQKAIQGDKEVLALTPEKLKPKSVKEALTTYLARKPGGITPKTHYIYILRLVSGKYYVGQTIRKNYRYLQHVIGDGAQWTARYTPLECIYVRTEICTPSQACKLEHKITLKVEEVYGADNVRGGGHCSLGDDTSPVVISLRDRLDLQAQERNMPQLVQTAVSDWRDYGLEKAVSTANRKHLLPIVCKAIEVILGRTIPTTLADLDPKE